MRAFLELRTREFGITDSYSGPSPHSTAGVIRGGMFMTLPYAMAAQSIDAKILCTVASNFKAAIYTSDGTLLAQSSEQRIPADSNLIWRTFMLTSPVILAASTNYILAVWSESSSGTNALGYYSVAGGNGRFAVESYGDGTFPPSVTFDTNNIEYNIHCNCNIPANVKTAIYLAADHSFIAGSEPVMVTETGWATFNFATPQPMLTESTPYLLVAWADNTADLAYTVGDYSTQGYTSDQTYGSWPSTLSGTVQNRKYSIYCFYKEPVPITFQTHGIGTLPNTETVLTIDGSDYAYSQFSQQIALDGQTSGISSGTNTISLTLPTTKTDDLLYVVVSLLPPYSVSSITSPDLTWNFRAATQYNSVRAETWYAVPSTSTSNAITITLSASHNAAAVAFGISGVDTASPFDGSATTSAGHGHFASSSLTAANENDFIIGALSVFDSPQYGIDWAAGGGFTNIQTRDDHNARTASAEYRIVSSTGTYTPSYSWNPDGDHDNDYAMIADALKQKPAGTESITFNWIPGSEHTVAATSPLSNGKTPGSWTNGDGLSGASGTYTTPGSATTVTVNYWAEDTNPPISAVSSMPSSEPSLTFDVPYSASDAGESGVQYVELYYSKDGGAWTKFGTTFTVSPISFTASSDGLYGFYTRATDNAGYIEDAPSVADSSTTVDTVKPVSEVSSLPTYQTSLTFNVPYSASDTGGSGVQYVELYYRVGGSGGYSKFGTTFASTPISFTASADGFYEFYTIATDNAGNVENSPESADTSTTVETTKPQSSVNTLSTSQTSLTFNVPYSASDTGGSGVQYVELYYSKDGGAWTKFGTTFTVSPISFKTTVNGFYEFYTRATDNAGNVENAPGVADASTTVAATPISVTFEASGLDTLPSTETVLTIDGTPYTWSQFAPPLALDGSTSGEITEGDPDTISMTLSTTKTNDLLYVVVALATYDHVSSISSPGLTWHLRVVDTSSEVRVETWYAVPSSSTSTEITITTNGEYYAAAVAFGISGVDTASPFDGSATTSTGAWDGGGPHSSSITTTNANDFIIGALAISNYPTTSPGYEGVWYQIIGTQADIPWVRATAEYRIVSEAGTYTPSYYFTSSWALVADAVKRAPGGTGGITFNWLTGSEHNVVASTYLSDGSAFDDWTNGDGLSGASGTYTTPGSATTVTVNYLSDETTKPVSAVGSMPAYESSLTFNVPYTASDANSGVQYVELYYRVGGSGGYTKFGATFTSSPISFTASADGFYEFYTRATDNAGNVEDAPESADASTTVDTTKPVSAVGSLPTEENSLTFDVPYTASDIGGSGVQYVELYYSKDGGAWTKFGTTFTVSPISFTASSDGLYGFYTRATDNAGYVEDAPVSPPDASTTVFTVAAEASYSPIGDSYTASAYPDTNYGTTSQLGVGVYPLNSQHIYIKFDLSSVPDSAIITSATLHLYKTTGLFPPPDAYTTSDFYSGTSTPWTETGITWNNASSIMSFLSSGSSEGGNWFGWDVTSYVTAEVAGDNILSLLLRYPIETSPGTGTYYASKETPVPNTSLRPWLDVSYTTASSDTVKPTSSVTAFGSSYTNAGSIAVSYSASDDSSGVANVHLWVKVPGSGSYADAGVWTSGSSYTFGADGLYEFYTIATDNAGNVEDAPGVADASTTVDTTDPSVSITTPASSGLWFTSSSVGFAGSATAGGSSLTVVEYQVDGGAWASATGLASWSFTASSLTEGAHTVNVRATAASGRTGMSSIVVNVDLTDPVVAITSPADGAYLDTGAFTVLGTASDTNLDKVQVKVNSGAYADATGTASWTYDISGLADGVYTITAKAIDLAGNFKETSVTLTVDTVKPTSSVTAFGSSYTNAGSIAVSYSASDDSSGVANVHLWVKVPGSGSYADAGVWTSGSSYTFGADGLYEFYTIATDNAGNVEDAPGVADASTTVDTTKPVSAVGSLPTYGTSLAFDVPYSASDAGGSGVQYVELYYRVGGSGGYSKFGSTFASSPISFTASGDGLYEFYTIATDNAGNVEGAPVSPPDASTTVDTAVPTGSIVINSGDMYTTSIGVMLTLSASDANGVAEMRFSFDGISWTVYELYGTSQSWFVPAGDGSKTVYVMFKDAAGLESIAYSDNIILDTAAPVTTDNYDGSWYTSDFTITLSPSDGTSGVAETYYKINGGTTMGVGSDGQPQITTESATNSLEYWSVDNAGNTENPHITVNNIKLDKTAPVTTLTIGDPKSGSDPTYVSATTTFTLSPTDSASGVDYSQFQFVGHDASLGSWTEYTGSFTAPGTGGYDLYYRSVDNAGNTETAKMEWIVVGGTAITLGGNTDGQYSDQVTLSAHLVDLATGDPIDGATISFSSDTSPALTASDDTDSSGDASVDILLMRPAGSYVLTVSFAGDSSYMPASDIVDPFTINKEIAHVEYTGDAGSVTCAGATDTTRTVRVAAQVTQDPDGHDGDLTKITLEFTIDGCDSESHPYSDSVSGVPVNSAGQAVAFLKGVPIGAYDITVRIEDNSYWRYDEDPNAIAVCPFNPDGYVTGGGWIPCEDSINGKINFAFVVHYDRRGNAKGSFVAAFKSKDGFTYRIKSTSWAQNKASLTFGNTEDDGSGLPTACLTFGGIVQIIDRATGEVVDSWGNCQFIVDMTDGDSEVNHNGLLDSIAITVIDNTNTVALQWGSNIHQIGIGGGNIVVASTKKSSDGGNPRKK